MMEAYQMTLGMMREMTNKMGIGQKGVTKGKSVSVAAALGLALVERMMGKERLISCIGRMPTDVMAKKSRYVCNYPPKSPVMTWMF
jgi:hypothetical protein